MTQKTTFLQGAKKLFLMAACFTLAVVLLGGTRAAASETTVTTDDGSTFTIGYASSKYDGYTLIGYSGTAKDVTLPATVTLTEGSDPVAITNLGDSTFAGNSAIRSIIIPENYTTIETSALAKCTGLTSVTIPGSMQNIYANAFEGCTSLTTVTFVENEKGSLAFKSKVFNGCTALENITLPVQTSSIFNNGNIFTGCITLQNITVSSGNDTYVTDAGSLYAKSDDGAALTLCTYVNVPAELTIPATASSLPVTTIGPMAFQKNTTLTAVTIPTSVTTIKQSAFDGCSNLKTVTLLGETAPTLGGSAFTNLAANSVIYVANETVAAAFAAPDKWTNYYTTDNTTVKVGAPSATTAASVSLKASETQEKGKVSFDLYLDSATELNTVMFQLTFDADQVSQGTVTVEDSNFTINDYKWETNDGVLTAVLKFGKAGDNLTSTEPVKLATITLPLNTGVTGSVTATISQAVAAGAGEAVGGQVVADITAKTASVFIASYDVNSDGTIDLKDIAEAQRYYQAENGDKNWDAAKAADVNGDGKVDLEDYTALFRAVVEAMGW